MSGHDQGGHESSLPDIDPGTPHPARIYDCLLGGKDHFPADREVAEQILAAVPQAGVMAKANRAFLQRAVRFLAAEAGIDQFLDLGSGLPTHGNVHETARQLLLDAKVVYVDNDPIVHAHGNALLADEQTTILFADLREPARIVRHPKVRRLLDLDRPGGGAAWPGAADRPTTRCRAGGDQSSLWRRERSGRPLPSPTPTRRPAAQAHPTAPDRSCPASPHPARSP